MRHQKISLFKECECTLSRFSRVRFFVTPWTVAHQLLCPWDSPGKVTGVGCHAFLQGIFPTQGSNLGLLCSCIARGFFATEPPEQPVPTLHLLGKPQQTICSLSLSWAPRTPPCSRGLSADDSSFIILFSILWLSPSSHPLFQTEYLSLSFSFVNIIPRSFIFF